MSKQPLSAKQLAFVREYIKDANATQAAIRAGYSKNSANPQAARLLAKASIQSAIREAQKKANTKAQLTRERALEILMEIAEQGERENNRIAAITQACKMQGWDAPQKHEIDQRIEDITDYSDVPTEKLRQIIGLQKSQ